MSVGGNHTICRVVWRSPAGANEAKQALSYVIAPSAWAGFETFTLWYQPVMRKQQLYLITLLTDLKADRSACAFGIVLKPAQLAAGNFPYYFLYGTASIHFYHLQHIGQKSLWYCACCHKRGTGVITWFYFPVLLPDHSPARGFYFETVSRSFWTKKADAEKL